MVSELHARKVALDAKLAEKNRELKCLCIQEAELTGVLPPECPLEPGVSPPIFRRRVGTAFAFPENLINNNKPKFKEEGTISALEQECQVQKEIAEAYLGIANDVTATKAVRRKHRHLYQQSQRELAELGDRLTLLRQSRNLLPKQRKKPRPPVENESCVDGDAAGMLHDGGISLSPPPVVQASVSSRTSWEAQYHPHHEPLMRHSSTHDGLAQHRTSRHNQPLMHPQVNRQGSGGYFVGGGPYTNQYSTLATCAHPEIERMESRRERLDQGVSAPGYWLRYEANETETAWFATAPRQVQRQAYHVRAAIQEHPPHHHVRESRIVDRFTGSLDRRKVPPGPHGGSSPSLEAWSVEETEAQFANVAHERISAPSYSHPLPVRQTVQTPAAETLLPGQTYPEHGLGLVRTQSLGSVEALKKHKEKEWYETSLDAAPVPAASPVRRVGTETGSDVGSNLSRSSSNVSSERRANQMRSRETPPSREGFESVVPFESPKNHTVVQAGKWQPYREVTKPFEMADFYKYSTKFRKNDNARPVSGRPNSTMIPVQGTAPIIHPRRVGPPIRGGPPIVEPGTEAADTKPQQKGVYQPLLPMACSPMDPNAKGSGEDGASVGETFSTEMLAWYQDKSLPRSATLV